LDGTVFIWKVSDPSRLETTLKEHEASVVAVAWQPAGNSLITTDKNKRVIVWADI
jgi:WD40 repeat protein